ncbi:hypothetical protein JOQ06_014499 [Pogonophryne albipinna]|uniref:Secreted protein n=1 Tax=Pogonophryne albipinna TaxID=1090488 RepID=A0AAD6AL90_9TELE|nr:hypothetical protein JOQ06_014499 [Pogonophryne albipinna]
MMAAGGVGGVKSLHILMLVLLQQLWFQPVTSTTEEPKAWRQTGPRLQLSHSVFICCSVHLWERLAEFSCNWQPAKQQDKGSDKQGNGSQRLCRQSSPLVFSP